MNNLPIGAWIGIIAIWCVTIPNVLFMIRNYRREAKKFKEAMNRTWPDGTTEPLEVKKVGPIETSEVILGQ
jgi:hypothetical protein